jgi:hypothetical protein
LSLDASPGIGDGILPRAARKVKGPERSRAMKAGVHKWMLVGDVMVAFTAAGRISDDIWNAYIKDLKEKRFTKYLGTSVGAIEIDSVRRKAGSEALRSRGIPAAIVTDERIVRGIVTAVSWLGVEVKPFAWTELREAINHLHVEQVHADKIFNMVMQLKTSYRAA